MTAGRSPAPTPAAGAGGGLVDDLEADGDLVGVDLEEVRPGFRAWAAPPPPPPPPPPPAAPPPLGTDQHGAFRWCARQAGRQRKEAGGTGGD